MPLFRIGIAVFALGAVLIGAGTQAVAARFLTGGFMGLNIPAAGLSYDLPSGDTVSSGFTTRAPAFAGSLGFRLSPQWRIGAEISYAASGAEGGGERQSRLALMNLYYDIDVGNPRIKPFLTVGAGLATHDMYRRGMDGLGLATESMTGMAWQAGAGLSYQINGDLSLSGGYRHVGGASLDDRGYDVDPDGHEIRLGVTYKFPVTRPAGVRLDRVWE